MLHCWFSVKTCGELLTPNVRDLRICKRICRSASVAQCPPGAGKAITKRRPRSALGSNNY